jgi:Uma2 family endonuclease
MMSTVLESPTIGSNRSQTVRFRTVADLVQSLGDIAPERIRMIPTPGTATEDDLLQDRGCELIDGVLVEKAMGFFEGRLGSILLHLIETWLESHDIGFCNGEGAYTRMSEGNVRVPDVSFFRWEKVEGKVPRDPVCDVAPNLAVEVLSRTNTKAEIDKKREQLFGSGVELMWVVDPIKETVEVWSSVRDCHIAGINDVLDGGQVLPGFEVSIKDWFERASGRTPPK